MTAMSFLTPPSNEGSSYIFERALPPSTLKLNEAYCRGIGWFAVDVHDRQDNRVGRASVQAKQKQHLTTFIIQLICQ
jgi:hypothetical protein